jgi:DNA-directed RNA polymerase subunit K/omega
LAKRQPLNSITRKRLTFWKQGMDAKRRVKGALNAIEKAIIAIKRARTLSDDSRSEIDKALRELNDAETNVRAALREIPDD